MEINFLNHASVIVRKDDVRLLMDPWLEGTAFEGGWGLRYDNPGAMAKIRDCTHLWVSHFHQDHFHRPTLRKILEINPEIIFLGNNSYNFQLDQAARQLGFRNTTPMYERKPVLLGQNFRVTRYPTRGIDNMLLIKAGDTVLLNYNDCVLPELSQKLLKKKFGHIDILLSNFNHAGKLFLYPFPEAEIIKQKLKMNFSANYKVFDPSYVLPFASYHYYRSPGSLKQNEAMLSVKDLLPIDKRILGWRIGDTLRMINKTPELLHEHAVKVNNLEALEYKKSYSRDEIVNAASQFAGKLRTRFGIFSRFSSVLYMQVEETGEIIGLKLSKGGFIPKETVMPHIKAHSEALMNWFTKPFGTDSFVVGAHFDIVNENRIPLKWQVAFGILVESKLDIRSMFNMLFSRRGLRFLKNRREEFLGHLLQFRLMASYHKDD